MCMHGYSFWHAVIVVLLVIAAAAGGDAAAAKVRINGRTSLCIERERQALLLFQQGLVDDYGQLSSWGMSKDCCMWSGVRCHNLTGYVLALDLHGPRTFSFDSQPLTGNISPSLQELQHLNYLDLGSNNFGNNSNLQIPEFIGSLSQLRYLDLSDNGFIGRFPQQLGNLTKLHFLDLSFNHLNVINLEWLSHLVMLRHLNLGDVDLGNLNWLLQLNKLPFLTELYLYGCGLPGLSSPSLPLTTNSSSMPNLAVIDISFNDYISSSEYHWLFNFSTSLVDVDISSNPLRGPIPDAFGNMISLTNLNLGGNQLDGPIPESFGNMISLTNLDLGSSHLDGPIPESFGNLSQLQTLELYSNNLGGQLPEFLQKLFGGSNTSLRTLNLDDNQLSGSLPDITIFSSLRQLRVRGNQLNGSFPESFGQVSNLSVLDLSGNQMTGPLPGLEVFPSLQLLDLSNNKLHGTLPISIGQFSELKILDASSNSFEGTITEVHLSNLSNLKELRLSFNSLALEFTSDWVPPFQLDIIRLAYCRLGTHFPKWLQTQNNYSELDISYAGISDTVPDSFWVLSPRISYLNLSYNQMSGHVPDLSSRFVDYPIVDLSSNHFEGPVPFFSLNLTSLDLSKNLFSGSVSFLCAIANEHFSSLDLSDNQLSGELPDCWMNMEELVVLNLANNSFSGKIPSSMGYVYQLQILQLRRNNFTGELPTSLKNCSELRIVDLGENKLSGKVPAWVGTHLTNLIVLSLRVNEFYGAIPHQICHLNYTQFLDLSRNKISGRIPNCFNNFTSLTQSNSSSGPLVFSTTAYDGSYFPGEDYVGNAFLLWKRQESEYRRNLGLLKIIDLSSNKLVGNIPREFASLKEVVSLNLSRNNLTGNIIQKIDQLKKLDSLDLSRNQLSGYIPVGLAQLTLLSVLDLSNNNLSGKIPSSTQLQSFDASNYAGNPELCGLPLPNKCPGDDPTTGEGKDNNLQEDKDEDRFITPGFYVSLVLGFAVGFWAVFGTLQLKSSWEYAYFKFLENMKDRLYATTVVNLAGLKRKFRR